MKANYHTHCTFCDGQADAETMVLAAIDAGYEVLGFSSHCPVPFPTVWALKAERRLEYRDRVRDLGRKYEDRITVLLGLEIEWMPTVMPPEDTLFPELGLDYRIGSTHFVTAPDGTFFAVDESAEDFETHLATAYQGNARALVEDYYRALSAMARHGGFDILGHFDLVLKNNAGKRYFDPDAPWYRDAAMQALEAVVASGATVEINTGGMARGKTVEPYPADWLVQEFLNRGTRFTIGADAHAPEHLAPSYYRKGCQMLTPGTRWEAPLVGSTGGRKNEFRQ